MLSKYKFILFLIFLASNLLAQKNTEIGLLPRLQVKTKLSEKLSLTNIAETRYFFFDKEANPQKHFTYELTDFSAFIAYKLKRNMSANVAYTIRLEPFTQSHRFIQQFKIANNFSSFTLKHRFGIDQTYNKHEFAVFRARYRLNFIKPLQGKILEDNEFYFKQGLEFVGELEHKIGDLEIRILPKLGFQANKNNTIEFGLDYRFSNFINNNIHNVFWCNIAWFTKINPKEKKE